MNSLLEQLRPGARFSKVPKLFGRISGDLILFVSSQRRGLEARNFAVISIFILFTTYEKKQFYRVSVSEFCKWLFWPEKFSGLSRNGPLGSLVQRMNRATQRTNTTKTYCVIHWLALSTPRTTGTRWIGGRLPEGGNFRESISSFNDNDLRIYVMLLEPRPLLCRCSTPPLELSDQLVSVHSSNEISLTT